MSSDRPRPTQNAQTAPTDTGRPRALPDRRSVRARITAIENEFEAQLSKVGPEDIVAGMKLAKQRGEMWPESLAPNVYRYVSKAFAALTAYMEDANGNVEPTTAG